MNYHTYLKNRTYKSFIYRNFILYPRISSLLPGLTLDIGCGIGDFISYHPNSIGVDIDIHNVNYCISRGLQSLQLTSDVLPFSSSYFDSIVMDNVLEHIAEPEALLKEIERVLSPKGILIIGVPGRRGYSIDPDHKVFYDKLILTKTLDKAGFLKKKIIGLPFSLPLLTWSSKTYCMYGIFSRK